MPKKGKNMNHQEEVNDIIDLKPLSVAQLKLLRRYIYIELALRKQDDIV
jgi:hypothetical protein